MQQLEAGFPSFERYFLASKWLTYGSDNMVSPMLGSRLGLVSHMFVTLDRKNAVGSPNARHRLSHSTSFDDVDTQKKL